MSIFGSPVTAASPLANPSGSTTTGTFATSVGDLIVCMAVTGNVAGASITSVTDVAGNSYTVVGSPSTVGNSGTSGSIFLVYCLAATHASAVNAITVNFASGTSFTLSFAWDVPLTGACSFDVAAFGGGNSGSSTPTTSSYSTASSDEIVFSIATNDLTGETYTQGTGYTLDSAAFATGTGGAQHIQFSSPQSGITTFMTSSGSGTFLIGAGAFEPYTSSPVSASISGQATVTASLIEQVAIVASINGLATVTGALSAPAAMIAAIEGLATVGGAAGFAPVVASIQGLSTVSGALEAFTYMVATTGGAATVSGALEALVSMEAVIQGLSTVIGTPQESMFMTAAIQGQSTVIGLISSSSSLRANILGQSALVGFLNSSKPNPQPPPYILRDFGCTYQYPAYIATTGNDLVLFDQPSFIPNVSAGTVMPPQWNTPGTPEGFNLLGRRQMAGQLLVAPGTGSLNGKIYRVFATGTIIIPPDAIDGAFNLVMNENYFMASPSGALTPPVSDTLFTIGNNPLPASIVGNVVGWQLYATLAGNGIGTSALASAGILYVGGNQYTGNGFSNRLKNREPIIQLSFGVQFSGTPGRVPFQALLNQFQIQQFPLF